MGKNTNRTNGLRFETELCERLAAAGWWAHDMAQTAAGQPADVIAARLNTPVLIDCKLCTGNNFRMSRVEPNQETAMELWTALGNSHAYFAVKYPSGNIYMISYEDYLLLKREQVHSIPEVAAVPRFRTFGRWLDRMEDLI